jgi:hypothetical protein
MRIRTWGQLTILATLVAASTASAQRGGMGGSRMGGRGGRGGSGEAAKAPTLDAKDFQSLDPAKLLLDKRKKLKLDDTQVAAMQEIEKRYDWNSRQFIETADSLMTRLAPARRGRGAGGASGVDGSQSDSTTAVDSTRKSLRDALRSVQDEFDLARRQSLATLRPEQVTEATDILEKPAAEFAQRLDHVFRR